MSIKLQMTDETWDERVKRSEIICSVIHFTIPSSDCKLPQSCYFKPSFPTRGCRLPSLLPIRLIVPAMCPRRNTTPWENRRYVCGYYWGLLCWSGAWSCSLLSYEKQKQKQCQFAYQRTRVFKRQIYHRFCALLIGRWHGKQIQARFQPTLNEHI